jgi:molybdate transport system regulatory protein
MGWKVKAQLMVGDEIAMGPGKADLLQAIADTGSISAAGRAMGLSYRRAWLMVAAMNRLFAEPLVLTVRGGPGGARLSDFGAGVLADYRRLQARLARSGTGICVGLEGRLKQRLGD